MQPYLEETITLTFSVIELSGNDLPDSGVPVITVYENGVAMAVSVTPVAMGGGLWYRLTIPLTTANGFEAGKCYAVAAEWINLLSTGRNKLLKEFILRATPTAGVSDVNVTQWRGAAVPAGVAGVPIVDVRYVNGAGPVGTVSVIAVSGSAITYSSPVNPADNTLTLVQGDDHAEGERLPSWQIAGYNGSSLVGATCKLRLIGIADYQRLGTDAAAALEVPGTLSQAGSDVTVSAALTAAQTAGLATCPPLDETTHQYQVVATTSAGGTVTLVLGSATVLRRIKP